MSRNSSRQEQKFEKRRRKLLKDIKGEAAIFCSAPEQVRSADQHFPYQQNADFLYLTGFEEPESILVLLGSTKGPRSILYLRDRDALRERWLGERLGLKRARRRFLVDEVRPVARFASDIKELLLPFQVLHYAAGSNPQIDNVVWQHYASSVGPRLQFPHTLKDARLLTSVMRVRKERDEIQSLRHVCDLTAQAFVNVAPLLRKAKSERHAAYLLESEFIKLGGHAVAFDTIVASGKNATVLHHVPSLQPLWKRELVLIDAGASFQGYAADISRTFPIAGRFSEPQAQVYDIVLSALEAALERSKPEADLEAVHMAAVKAIVKGLTDLGILKGAAAKLIQEQAYRPYYMHRTSHWLGLDVHDASPIYCDEFLVPPLNRPLEPGYVFTIEPGLYFDPNDKTVPKEFRGIGIRIEEDVVITPGGHEVLTSKVPRARADVEALMGEA